MLTRRAASMLSLAKRAGKLICGEDTVIMALKSKECYLIIIADDASENTKNKIMGRAAGADVKCLVMCDRQELSSAVGMYNRAVFAVTDSGFADKIEKELLSE